MNKLLLAIFLTAFSLTPIYAQLAPAAGAISSAPKSAGPDEADLQTHGHYVNKDGQTVHSPAKSVDGKVPSGASAQCRDGSYSFSRHHSGTCSHHGGVADWLK